MMMLKHYSKKKTPMRNSLLNYPIAQFKIQTLGYWIPEDTLESVEHKILNFSINLNIQIID